MLIGAVIAAFFALPVGGALACDPLDPSACLYPWPNDHFTTPDASSPTGKRLAFRDDWMPRNRLGKPVSSAPYNFSDGFSPGNMIVTKVPGLDTPEAFARTGAVPITDIARTFDAGQPIVVINARTLERHLIWSELDANPADPRDVTLIIRPAVNFEEGERYIVALRNLTRRGRPSAEGAGPLRRPARPQAERRDRGSPSALRGDLPDARSGRASSARSSTWPGTSRSRAGRA